MKFNNYEEWLNHFKTLFNSNEIIEIDKVHSYTYRINNNILLKENTDLKSQKGLERYNRFINSLNTKNFIDYKRNDFNEKNYEDCIYIFKQIIYTLLGNDNEINDILNQFINLITYNESEDVLEGNVLQFHNVTNNSIKYAVNIPLVNNESSIICMIHEFMHYLSFIKELNTKKSYYNEILSIFGEKYATNILKGQGSTDIEKKIENIRLSNIKFHYNERLDDIETYRLFAKKESDEYLNQFYKEYKMFAKSVAQSYGLGYLYSTYMLKLYNTENNFIIDFNNLINNKINLQDILDKYSINMDNKEVVEESKKQIRLIIK